MVELDQHEGRFRVLLIGVGNNSEAEKDSFCEKISKGYRIPFADARKIVDRCPVILKKNLPLRKAESIAKAFSSLGGSVSIEEKRQIPRVSLEFQELAPRQLALESSYVQKSQRGTWSVTGRTRNISDGTLNDTWVLVQFFQDFEEFISFEEAPLPINPLPSEQTSPFKVIFEGDPLITRISIAFKNASGQPIPAVDKRKKRERVKTDREEERTLSPLRMTPVFEERSEAIEFAGPLEIMFREEEKLISETIPLPLEREIMSPSRQEVREVRGDAKKISEESLSLPVDPVKEFPESSSILVKESSPPGGEESEKTLGQDTSLQESGREAEKTWDGVGQASVERQGAEEHHLGASAFQEATQLLKEISGSPEEAEVEEKTDRSFSWIGYFRDAVETFHQTSRDAFSIWFEECRKKGDFKNSLHSLLTILVHSRFLQGSESNKTLENIQKLFQLIVEPNLLLDQIPPLEGPSFASGEVWKELFQRALPKVHQVGNTILEKRTWNVLDLERMIQVIPQMGHQNSRMAIRWTKELIPDAVEVDFSETHITIGEGLYRVASRLGIVSPHLDVYDESGNSIGDTKIQSFAIIAFPDHPAKVEKPMSSMGGAEEQGGHCFPVQPWCEGCLFNAFCPKLYLDFNPSEKGMKAL